MYHSLSSEEQRERDLNDAKQEIIKLKAIRQLLEFNDLACEVTIHSMKFGTSLNSNMIPIVDYEIGEIEKFIKGEPNTWE